MRDLSLLSILFLAAASVPAQSNHDRFAAVLTAPVESRECPIGFYAKRQSGLVERAIRSGKQDGFGQRLQLTFDHLQAPGIAKASVTIYGVSGNVAYTPVAHTDRNGDVSEIFSLERRAGAVSLQNSEVWTRKIQAVRWVELTEIDYVNGSEWHKTKESQCRVEPSLLLEVNSH